VSSKGSLHGNFQRAIECGNLFAAEAAAYQLHRLSVADALSLCLLLAEQDPERFQRDGARWHARFVLEAQGIALMESQLLLAAVAALPAGDKKAVAAIRELGRRYRVPNVEAAIRHPPC
jgi:hypothetical protein